MVNDEMLKKLKDQYIGVEVPDDEKIKLNEILEYAKIDRKRKRKKVIITRWMISVAALLLVVIMPNTNETLASSLENIPLVGNIFTVITVRKYDKDKNINLDTTVQDKNLTGAGENKIKNHHYEVVEFGKAKYKFDEKAKDSFYVKYKTTKDEIIDIWGEDLERVVKENDVKVGEFVKFKVTDKTPVEVQTKKLNKKTNKWTVYKKTALKNVWDCSILGRAEKDLKMVSDKENRKPIYSSKVVISELEKKTAEFIRMKKEREAKQGLNLSSKNKGNKFAHLKKKDDLER